MALMSRTRIKICGIRDVATAEAAVRAGADAVGLVFVPGTPRYIEEDEARRIIASLPPFVEPVGLFVDKPLEAVRARATGLNLRTVQLHGREGPGYVAELSPLQVIKAVSFDPHDFSSKVMLWRGPCANLAALIVDAPPPAAPPAARAAQTGGHGRPFDWDELAARIERGDLSGLPPLILAGGLTPDNVGRAVQAVRPWAVDVSSGVETTGHRKDPAIIEAFCRAVRQADAAIAAETAMAETEARE